MSQAITQGTIRDYDAETREKLFEIFGAPFVDGGTSERDARAPAVTAAEVAIIAGQLGATTRQLRAVAHVEGGVRAFNRQWPEEHNRIVADHLSDLILAPTDEVTAAEMPRSTRSPNG